jgi:hypothetical protein
MQKIDGLPVIDVDESEKITVAVGADDLLEGDTANPDRHPIAIALRRQDNVDEARVTKNETLVPWQEVVPLRCPGQAVVQAVAKDNDDVAGLGIAGRKVGSKSKIQIRLQPQLSTERSEYSDCRRR